MQTDGEAGRLEVGATARVMPHDSPVDFFLPSCTDGAAPVAGRVLLSGLARLRAMNFKYFGFDSDMGTQGDPGLPLSPP